MATTSFTGDENGRVNKLHGIRVGPAPKFEPIPGTEFTLDAGLVLLAMGFTGPVQSGLIEQLGVKPIARPAICGAANPWLSGPSPRGVERPRECIGIWSTERARWRKTYNVRNHA